MTRFINNDEDLGIAYLYNDDFHRSKTISKTKKSHTCAFCEGEILAGSACNYIIGKAVGQFFYYHSHATCPEDACSGKSTK
jgi:hypothetical protein